MAKAEKGITKSMKFQLIYIDGCGDYTNLNSELWQIQKQVREICNYTLQEMYLWDHEDKKYYEQTGQHLSIKEQTGGKFKRIDGYVYDVLKSRYSCMYSSSINCAVRKAYQKYNQCKMDIWTGKISLPSYKADQPIMLIPDQITYAQDARHGRTVTLKVFGDKYRKSKEYDYPRFVIKAGDGTQQAILDRLENHTYTFCESQLQYEKKCWYLLLSYSFTPEQKVLDKDKILGVDMGAVYAIFASSFGNRGTFKIPGDEVDSYAKKLEAIKYARQKQARYCGEGRIGHGTKTRVAPIYDAENAIANFRDTINHRYSKALIDYAVKNGYGTIQMEDLSGIQESTGFQRRLRHWTYYDLQTKISYKAAAAGIEIKKIKPAYTSQRCSHCGYIDSQNRKTQETFHCIKCGFDRNADYNASQNISIPNIDKIIEKEMKKQKKANPDPTEESK